jgi:hypothetical protein
MTFARLVTLLRTVVLAAAAVSGTVWILWFTAEPRRYVRVEAEAEADTTGGAVVPVCEGSAVRYFPAPVRLHVERLP